MLTVGVDLAAEPKGTAASVIDWSDGRAILVSVTVGASDDELVALSHGSDKIGIDCALGWPSRFVDFLVAHRSDDHSLSDGFGAMDWRRCLSYRETDRRVHALTGRWPLSVATDRLGVTALRCAGLVARLGDAGVNVDRSGWGGIVEVYPAGSLKFWDFDTAGYRVSIDVRARLIDNITARAPWLFLSEFRDVLVDSCDAFDSVIASFAARAAAIQAATLPKGDDMDVAKVEGWIAIPTVNLSHLARSA